MSTRDLKHPWKPSVWIIWIGAIVLGSWLLQGIRTFCEGAIFYFFLWEIVQDKARSCRAW